MPQYIQLNLRALRRHAPPDQFDIVILNETTIDRYITVPPEFPRLRSHVARSDIARLGLLAKYGGLYLDADVLVSSTLKKLSSLLDEHEIVGYTAPGQDCRAGVFSSNFIATRPNSSLWADAFDSAVHKLQQRCGPPRRHKVCCYDSKGGPLPCRTPWALTDFVMKPIAMQKASEFALSLYCLDTNEGLTPWFQPNPNHFTLAEASCLNMFHIYTLALRLNGTSSGGSSPSGGGGGASAALSSAVRNTDWSCGDCISNSPREGPNATLCCRKRGNTLECRNSRGISTREKHFFNRWAYHLFESINGHAFRQQEAHGGIENADLAVSHLYRRALGLGSR